MFKESLINFCVTEKTNNLLTENKYVFQVHTKTNKSEIKKEIQRKYKVNVLNVRIINIPRKKIRIGRQEGWKKGQKKAIVKIKKGQTIENLAQ